MPILVLLIIVCFTAQSYAQENVTFEKKYKNAIKSTDLKVNQILQKVHKRDSSAAKNLNLQTINIINALKDIPYLPYATGEGGVLSSSNTPIDQNPLYRLDGLDCQTFVQMVMALLYSHNVSEFKKNIIKISYGGGGEGEHIDFYNRNHFVEVDFNEVNQQNHFITDATLQTIFTSVETRTITVNKKNWFLKKIANLLDSKIYNHERIKIFASFIHKLHAIPQQKLIKSIEVNYIPKAAILKSVNLNKIPAPAILEIINDSNKWYINGKNIKSLIDTDLMVSHMGILYRKKFHYKELIYNQIKCQNKTNKYHYGSTQNTAIYTKACQIQEIRCDKEMCNELMLAHASNAHPAGYYWYKDHGRYICDEHPHNTTLLTTCNRIEVLPFTAYIKDNYLMINPAILGFHIEKLLTTNEV